MERMYRLGEMENEIRKLNLESIPDDLMGLEAKGEEYHLVVSGWWVYVPRYKVNLQQGVVCRQDVMDAPYLPDVCVTVLREEKKMERAYFMDSTFIPTLYHWLMEKYPVADIETSWSILQIPNEEEAAPLIIEGMEEIYEMYNQGQ